MLGSVFSAAILGWYMILQGFVSMEICAWEVIDSSCKIG